MSEISVLSGRLWLQCQCEPADFPLSILEPTASLLAIKMSQFNFYLPEDFDNNEWEIKEKGFFQNSFLILEGIKYQLVFYDKYRLAQEIDDELASSNVFLEKNLVVIDSIDRKNMELAVNKIMADGRYLFLSPEATS